MNIPHIPIHKTTKAPATNHRVINKPEINKPSGAHVEAVRRATSDLFFQCDVFIHLWSG